VALFVAAAYGRCEHAMEKMRHAMEKKTQWKKKVRKCNGQARREIPRSTRSTPVFPLSRKKNGTFGTFFGRRPTKILKIGTCIFWTQFPSLEKISQNTFLIFFQRCTGHIFTIEAVFRSQHIESSDVFWEFSACKV